MSTHDIGLATPGCAESAAETSRLPMEAIDNGVKQRMASRDKSIGNPDVEERAVKRERPGIGAYSSMISCVPDRYARALGNVHDAITVGLAG